MISICVLICTTGPDSKTAYQPMVFTMCASTTQRRLWLPLANSYLQPHRSCFGCLPSTTSTFCVGTTCSLKSTWPTTWVLCLIDHRTRLILVHQAHTQAPHGVNLMCILFQLTIETTTLTFDYDYHQYVIINLNNINILN